MNALLTRILRYVDFDVSIFTKLEGLRHQIEVYRPGQQIVNEGDTVVSMFVVENGWAIRYRILDDGRRQIVNFMLPGDCFDMMSLTRAEADHSVNAATEVEIRRIESADFLEAVRSDASLATAFWWVAIQEESILREQIIRIGRRSAIERVGHLILELNRRMEAVTGERSDFVNIPIPQSLFADALGLSVVHISRTLKKLREKSLVVTTPDGIEILNREVLEKMCGFESQYFHFDKLKLTG